MPRIIVQRNNKTYKEYFLRPFQTTISVGSYGDNDLILADIDVKQHHFIIRKKNASYFIELPDDSNQVFLNGKVIKSNVKIESGDVIKVGSHRLIFDDELSRTVSSQNLESDAAITVKDQVETAPPETEIPTQGKGSQKQNDEKVEDENESEYCLIAIYGPYLGKVYPLNKVTTKIGRDNLLNDIVIDRTPGGEKDTSISRRHATIVYSEGFYYLLDKRSKTRTRLNGKALSEDDVLQLSPNDEIEIVSDKESTIFRFCPVDKMNFARPRKCGTWWIRNRHRVGWSLSVIALILLSFVLYNLTQHLRLIQSKPEELTLNNELYIKAEVKESLPEKEIQAHGNSSVYTAASGDFDGDGFLDLAFFDRFRLLNVLSGKTKKRLWENYLHLQSGKNSGITVADVDNNGSEDIVLSQRGAIITALEGKSGMEFWSSPILGGSFLSSPIVGYLNEDDTPDVLGAGEEGICHFSAGRFGEPEWLSEKIADALVACMAVNIDDDRHHEIVAAAQDGKIIIGEFAANDFKYRTLVDFFAGENFVGDSLRNLLVAEKSDGTIVFCSQSQRGRIFFADINGNKLARKDIPEGFISNLAQVRILKDLSVRKGSFLVIGDTSKVYCYDLESFIGGNNIEPIWKIELPGGKLFLRNSVPADIDKDGAQDLVVPLWPCGLGIISGQSGKLFTSFVQGNRRNEMVLGEPLVADFDADNYLDILICLTDGSFQIFKTNSKCLPGTILWGQYRGTSLKNGIGETKLAIGWAYPAAILTASLLIFAIFALNFVFIEQRRSFFSKEISEK